VKKGIRSDKARLVEVDIERVVYGGDGLARHDGQVIFVPRGLPGERLRALVVEEGKGFARGRAAEWLTQSAERRTSPCPLFPRCGGCAHQDVAYEFQQRLKVDILRETLKRAGVVPPEDIGMTGSPEDAWRSRARFHVEGRFGDTRLGLYAQGSHRVVDIDYCLQLSAPLNAAAGEARRLLQARPALAAAATEVLLVEAYDGSARVAVFRLRSAAERVEPDPVEPEAHSGLSGFGISAPGPEGERYIGLWGDSEVRVDVAGIELRAHATSFFQANRFVVPQLVAHVASLVPAGEKVADLYAGIGFFAAALAAPAEQVVAVEDAPSAVADARANIARLRLTNVAVRRSDVAAFVRDGHAAASTTVILDPPRAGAGKAVMAGLGGGKARRIVYVSCDPPTLARDLREAAAHGFELRSLHAFDMFPDTSHLESVALLER
jgi:tRNA/tmRNA/rRNA uracil-C5-methylase (TrmA/RlmC/RlmD family)